jgi:hypothetical protein
MTGPVSNLFRMSRSTSQKNQESHPMIFHPDPILLPHTKELRGGNPIKLFTDVVYKFL